ncbi:MAG: UDP-N-acetylmuramoyl-tripeptide--D-alanyl-D-alanine ligase, partial [Chloroflexota bacterium]
DTDGRLLLLVDDPLSALQRVAAWWRRHHRARVLAVAGSVGKTTTKELLANILDRRFRVLRTPGNFNNELGLPITLLQLTPEHQKVALEIGISDVGEMATFAAIGRPDVAVITRIAAEHMHHLKDLDTVEQEDGRLVEALSSAGVAVLNADDERVARMADRTPARVVSYGESDGADVRGSGVESLGLDGLAFDLHLGQRDRGRRVRLPLVGRHFVTAALAATTAAFEEGCAWEDVVAGLSRAPATRRLEPRTLLGGVTLLDDSYNASPDSTMAALDVLAALPGRRIAVLGDMLELGDYAATSHRQVGAYVPGHADLLVTVGDLSRETAAAAQAAGLPADCVYPYGTSEAVPGFLRDMLVAGDNVLVKASHGMRLDTIARALAGASGP